MPTRASLCWIKVSAVSWRGTSQFELGDAFIRSDAFVELSNVHEALNLSPEDQSLWYYHQYLTHAIATATGKGPIVRDLSVAERKNYLKNEQEFLQDLLIDYHDVKWIYEAAVECILAADALSTPEEQELNGSFLAECFRNLKELDQNRRGRWEDIEGTLLSHVD